MNILIIGIGAFLGGILRYLLTAIIKIDSFPFSMLLINVLGSFFIGVVSILFRENIIISKSFYIFLTTGILGGFTSFSAFSLETLIMLENGKIVFGVLNIFLSITLCLSSCLCGRFLAKLFFID